MREHYFETWIKDKSKVKELKIPKDTHSIFTKDPIYIPGRVQELARTIIQLGERDGELGIQALILRARTAESRKNSALPNIYLALDTVAAELGFVNRNELIQFFDPPFIDSNTKYEHSPDKTFDDKLSDAYSKVLKVIQQLRPNIPVTLPRIAELVQTPKKYVEDILQAILEQKPMLGEFLNLEQVFILKEDTDELIDDLISHPISRYGHFHCPNCQEIIENRSANVCPACGEAVLRCVVCKLPISSEDGIGKCSECEGLAHLNHLQEWVKVHGKCPTCLQKTEVIIVKEAVTVIEELPYGIDLSRIRIVDSGEWTDVPDGSVIGDVQGFFNMLFATDEKKLYMWRRGDKHAIGFFEHGKFFIHEMKLFDSVKEYLIGLTYGFTTPEALQFHREALQHGWENREIAVTVWKAILKDYIGIPLRLTHSGGEAEYNYRPTILGHPFIKEKYQKILSLRHKRGLGYEMLPPYDSHVTFGEDWFVWFLAYHNGWNSFRDLYDFAERVFPKFKEKYQNWVYDAQVELEVKTKDDSYKYDFKLHKEWSTRKSTKAKARENDVVSYLGERNDRFLKLVYLAVHGPFKEGDDWLQGWPSFDSLMVFWTNLDELRFIFESRDEFLYPLRRGIEAELLPMKAYPAILPYDPSCKTALDWVIKAAEQENWSPIGIETLREQKQ